MGPLIEKKKGLSNGGLRPSEWVFIGLMLTINFEYLFVRLFDFDSIWKPYRILGMIGGILAWPTWTEKWGRYRDLMGPFFCAVCYALGLSMIFVVLDIVDADSIFRGILLLAIGLSLTICTSAASEQAIRVGMIVLIVGLFVNLCYSFGSLELYRATGFFRNPNHYGAALALGCLSAAMLRRHHYRMFWGCTQIVFLLGIFMTGSRGSLAAVILALLYGAVRRRGMLIVIVSLFFLGVVGNALFGDGLRSTVLAHSDGRLAERYTVKEITRASYRKELSQAAIQLGIETSFVGVGISQFANTHFYDLVHRFEFFEDKYGHQLSIHNFYLTLLVEWGFPAFLLMMLFFVRAIRQANQYNDAAGRFAAGLCVMFALIAATADVTAYLHFWISIGLVMTTVCDRNRVLPSESSLTKPQSSTFSI